MAAEGGLSRRAEAAWAVAWAAALTLLFCAGPAMQPFSPPVAPPFADLGQTQWNLWWIGRVAFGEQPPGALFRTDQLFFPNGAPLVHHTMEYLWGVLLAPVQAAGGLFAQHNAALLLATWGTALGAWFAARAAGGTWRAGALASLALALHSYRLGEAHHLNIFSTLFFPVVLGGLLCWERAPERRRWPLLVGGAGALALATSLFHALGAGILAMGWLAAALLRADAAGRRLLLRGIVLAGVVAAPAAAGIVLLWAGAPAPPRFGPEAQARLAADGWQFLLHPRLRALLTGTESLSVADLFLVGDTRPLLWYLPGYVLAAGGVAVVLRRVREEGAGRLLAILAAGGCFAVLALGPWLKLGSPTESNPAAGPVPLPGWLLQFVPLLGTVRSVWHFGFLATMCWGIAGAVAVEHLLRRLPAEKRRLAGLVVGAVVFAETFVGAIPTAEDAYGGAAEALRRGGGAPMAALPNDFYEARGLFMHLQARTGRALLSGYLSRDPASFEAWRVGRAWPRELEDVGYGRRKALNEGAAAKLREDVAGLPITSLFVWDPLPEQPMVRAVAGELERLGVGRLEESGPDWAVFVLAVRSGRGGVLGAGRR